MTLPAWARRPGAVAIQAAVLLAVVVLVAMAAANAATNLGRLGINAGFGFLGRPTGFAISQSLIPYSETSTYLRALEVAALNTIVLALLSAALATPIGFAVGIGRRSSNGLVSALATGYVEVIRNVPLLLQLFFWYFAMLRPLPPPRQSLSLLGMGFLSVRGLALPWPQAEPGFAIVVGALVVGILLAVLAVALLAHRRATAGAAPPAWPALLGLVAGPPLLAAIVEGFPLRWELPHLSGFNFEGGVLVQPELVAMTLALAFYSAAYIAEIVRAGLDAVPRGQVEAARALGLKPRTVSARIVVPQSLRVILPPLGNEYLRLFRNTTLAPAIAYPDLTLIFAGTALNQTAQPFEVMVIVCAAYLAINLAASMAINAYNRHLARFAR
ncbi:MAG TPA: ABC transporter permease subunit [Stellaceae bacterium]|nr:ABC transporter permease subunit [Stellaceae bacterium]